MSARPDRDEDIVIRLRYAADLSANGGGEWYQLIHRCREAADRIEFLAGRVADLEAANALLNERLIARAVELHNAVAALAART